jgi:hypothetical protein
MRTTSFGGAGLLLVDGLAAGLEEGLRRFELRGELVPESKLLRHVWGEERLGEDCGDGVEDSTTFRGLGERGLGERGLGSSEPRETALRVAEYVDADPRFASGATRMLLRGLGLAAAFEGLSTAA